TRRRAEQGGHVQGGRLEAGVAEFGVRGHRVECRGEAGRAVAAQRRYPGSGQREGRRKQSSTTVLSAAANAAAANAAATGSLWKAYPSASPARHSITPLRPSRVRLRSRSIEPS